MNRLFGSGGRTKIDSSSMAAAMSDVVRSRPRSSPDSRDGQAADEVARERVGRERRQAGLDVLDEARSDDGLRGHERDDPAASLLAGGQRLAQQVLDVEDLDAALAHPRDELVVLPLGALDPQDVVEQQLVVVARGQPLEAEVRPMDDDLAELADLRVDTE